MEWQSPDFLLRIWRRREAQLLRLLSAKNLGMIRDHFEREAAASRKSGLSVADFVRVMMKLLGALVINQEELCIQILELFANIDVSAAAEAVPTLFAACVSAAASYSPLPCSLIAC